MTTLTCADLVEYEASLGEIVKNTPHTTTALRATLATHGSNRAIKCMRSEIAVSVGSKRQEHIQCLRKLRRERRQQIKLQRIRADARMKAPHVQLSFVYKGNPITDRSKVTQEAFVFGETRFSDDSNNLDRQTRRLQALYSEGRCESIDSKMLKLISLIDVLQSRA